MQIMAIFQKRHFFRICLIKWAYWLISGQLCSQTKEVLIRGTLLNRAIMATISPLFILIEKFCFQLDIQASEKRWASFVVASVRVSSCHCTLKPALPVNSARGTIPEYTSALWVGVINDPSALLLAKTQHRDLLPLRVLARRLNQKLVQLLVFVVAEGTYRWWSLSA